MNANLILRNAGRYITRQSPSLLTGLGVAGVIATTVLAVKATPKAMILIGEYREAKLEQENPDADLYRPMNALDYITAAWKAYIPTIVMGGVTITAIIAANSISLRRNAALASLFAVAQTSAQEYQKKVVEMIGAKKEELLRGEIAQDQLNANPVNANTIIISGGGDTLCYDAYSGRYFKSDMERIKQAMNEFNRRILVEDYLPINEWYDMLGLEGIVAGNMVGWRVDETLLWINFSAKVAANNQPCLVLQYSPLPTEI